MKQSSNFDLDIIVHGDSIRKYFHDGKYYVEGRKGSDFAVRIKNNTGKRVLAVLTVDGLSAIDGKTGSFESTGYILDAWVSTTIPGWRLNNKEVAKFEFERGDKSYASSKGKGIHNGVIGCAFFYEKENNVTITNIFDLTPHQPVKPWNPWEPWKPNWPTYTIDNTSGSQVTYRGDGAQQNAFSMQAASANFSSADNSIKSVASSSLGTGFGDRASHKVTTTDFDRSTSYPIEVLTVYYDDRKGLLNRGIDLDGTVEIASPFPNSQAAYDHYCQPPQHWEK